MRTTPYSYNRASAGQIRQKCRISVCGPVPGVEKTVIYRPAHRFFSKILTILSLEWSFSEMCRIYRCTVSFLSLFLRALGRSVREPKLFKKWTVRGVDKILAHFAVFGTILAISGQNLKCAEYSLWDDTQKEGIVDPRGSQGFNNWTVGGLTNK
jgi:hypothetical protein